MNLVLENIDEQCYSWNDFQITRCIKKLIEYNPTYDLNYLWEVIKYTIASLVFGKYGFVLVEDCILITRMLNENYIARIKESAL